MAAWSILTGVATLVFGLLNLIQWVQGDRSVQRFATIAAGSPRAAPRPDAVSHSPDAVLRVRSVRACQVDDLRPDFPLDPQPITASRGW